LIIACVGDISKLQLYIWSSYGLLAEIKKILSLSSPLFFEVYAQVQLCGGPSYVILLSVASGGTHAHV
jgi:hypothetical protein